MKFRYVIGALLLGLGLVSACTEEPLQTLSELKVSESYISIDVAGSTSTVTLNATQDWSVVAESVPEWLTVSPMNGAAGETKLSFTAGATTATRNAEVKILCNAKNQFINVIQYAEKVEPKMSTVAEVLAGADGDVFRVKGVCSSYDTGNANAVLYGNWYITDDTGTVYIYGTLNKAGQTKGNPLTDWGIEVGDIVTIEGPRSTYGSTIELVDVTVIAIEKSLIGVDSVELLDAEEGEGVSEFPLEGGSIKINLNVKGDGFHVTIPDAAKNWLHIEDFGSSYVTLRADANGGGDRSAEVTFSTEKGGVSYTCVQAFTQKGAILPISCAGLNALTDGDALYRVKGVITSIVMDKSDATKYNAFGNFHIVDETGDVYVYGLLDGPGGASGKDVLTTMGAKVGDVITVVGPKASYNGAPQMKNAYCEAYVPVTAKTCAEFNALADGNDLYLVSGKITEIVMDKNDATKYNKYGNFYVQDDSGEKVYVYGLVTTMASTSGQDILTTLGVKVGDVITVVGPKASYNNAAQMKNAFYVSHEAPAALPTLTVNISEVATQFQWVNAEYYQSFEWEGFSFVASGQGEQNGQPTYNGAYNEASGQWRFYQARAVATLTITAPTGKEFVSATFTYAVTNTGVLLDSGGNQVKTDTKVALSGNSVAFTVGNTSETVTNGQVRFTKIVIEYQ